VLATNPSDRARAWWRAKTRPSGIEAPASPGAQTSEDNLPARLLAAAEFAVMLSAFASLGVNGAFPVMLSPFAALRANSAKHLYSSFPHLSGQPFMRTAEILRRPSADGLLRMTDDFNLRMRDKLARDAPTE
jgi:hypothetical protein